MFRGESSAFPPPPPPTTTNWMKPWALPLVVVDCPLSVQHLYGQTILHRNSDHCVLVSASIATCILEWHVIMTTCDGITELYSPGPADNPALRSYH